MAHRQARHPADGARGLSVAAREVLGFLGQRGASFFADIVRGTGRLKSEVETGLWELVAAGLVTADGFDNLRALIDPKRRSGHGAGRSARSVSTATGSANCSPRKPSTKRPPRTSPRSSRRRNAISRSRQRGMLVSRATSSRKTTP